MQNIKKVLLPALLFLCLGNSHAASCSLKNLLVKPVTPGKKDVFHGETSGVEIRFTSLADDAEVDVFPEPPLLITQKQTNRQCEINGGIWVRKDVYLSQNEQVLVTHEYSGSNDFLMFYKTSDCSKIQEIDISYAKWKIHGTTINVLPETDGKKPGKPKTRIYQLDAACKTKTH
ncbi:hypothetical protein [Undibacterium sp. TJN19]|uniref:hypothetical protein n=1 Tax=Undibacterium sp. TJN19 TaxID=3413055 RepID=UPI003BF3B4AE